MAHIRKRKLKDGSTAFRVIWVDAAGHEQSRQFSKAGGPRPSEAAHDYLLELQRALRQGTYINPRGGDVTVRAFAQGWLQNSPNRATSVDDVGRLLRVHVYPVLGDATIGALRPSDLAAALTVWRTTKARAGGRHHLRTERALADSTVRNIVRLVKTLFNAAVSQELIPRSPARFLVLQEPERDNVIIPTEAQIATVLDRVPVRLEAVVQLVIGSGLRSGELRGLDEQRLTWLPEAGVRVDRQLRSVRAGTPVYGPPKSKAGNRWVPLEAGYAAVIAEHLRRFGTGTDGLIFTSNARTPYPRETLQARIRPALRAAGLPTQTGLHVFRHYYASGLIASGLDVLTVSRMLGHASVQETQRTYAHLWQDYEAKVRAAVALALPARPLRVPEGRRRAGRPSGGRPVQTSSGTNTLDNVVQMPNASSG